MVSLQGEGEIRVAREKVCPQSSDVYITQANATFAGDALGLSYVSTEKAYTSSVHRKKWTNAT